MLGSRQRRFAATFFPFCNREPSQHTVNLPKKLSTKKCHAVTLILPGRPQHAGRRPMEILSSLLTVEREKIEQHRALGAHGYEPRSGELRLSLLTNGPANAPRKHLLLFRFRYLFNDAGNIDAIRLRQSASVELHRAFQARGAEVFLC